MHLNKHPKQVYELSWPTNGMRRSLKMTMKQKLIDFKAFAVQGW